MALWRSAWAIAKASDHLQIAECGGVGLGRHSLSYAQESRGFVRKCGAGHIVQRAMQPCHIGVLVPSMALDCEDFGNCRSFSVTPICVDPRRKRRVERARRLEESWTSSKYDR